MPQILCQCDSSNYLYRETILFFIRETMRLVGEDTKCLYREVV